MNPLAYAPQPLLRPTLLGAGVTDGELHRLRRAGALVPIQRGAYLPAENPGVNDARERHGFRVTAELTRVAPDAAVSHASAAVLYGLPVWHVPLGLVHVTKPRRSGGRRTGRLYVHTAPLRVDEIETVRGKRVTSPARTVADLARTLPFEPALVIADAALHGGLVTPGELADAVRRVTGWRGAPAARRVVAFADGLAESVGESRSRVAIAHAGLPPPVPQWELAGHDGVLLGRVDFWWPDHGLVGEFDGRVKYGRPLRPGQDPSEVVFAEKLREDAIRAQGYRFVRWTWRDLDHFAPVAARLFPPGGRSGGVGAGRPSERKCAL